MADLSTAPGASPGTVAEAHDSPSRAFYPEAVQHNVKQISYIRSISLSLAGSASGVLGLTNLNGFYFYIISQLLISLCILFINAKGQPTAYLVDAAVIDLQRKRARVHAAMEAKSGGGEKAKGRSSQAQGFRQGQGPPGLVGTAWMWINLLLVDGAQDNVLSYVLWWTFWYGIVHVYD
ncbi:hypothetical protein K437DRAFT_258964 [Tilletiaria anomala UBC 951]|uniref:ER membrane protein complex subunit 6 n=1 Tax=Tilletiaria anomala (strain ATCC 24038 / CBS 436.72 / UBC 951) TaxID=1037660 RepID=A0A066VDZ5_TILAU|nr:uncharacterized protein K437DRAFT_258964 [Tilletiaria anomala UBC 951]KDN39691.1 hypothetical protein K437DRAFT_258964 [Tilletiaria anomala UBC 951]